MNRICTLFETLASEYPDKGPLDLIPISFPTLPSLQKSNGSWEDDMRFTGYITSALLKAKIYKGWSKEQAREYIAGSLRAVKFINSEKKDNYYKVYLPNFGVPLGTDLIEYKKISLQCQILPTLSDLGLEEIQEEIIQNVLQLQHEKGFFGNPSFPPNFPWLTGAIVNRFLDAGVNNTSPPIVNAVQWLLTKTKNEQMLQKIADENDPIHPPEKGAAMCLAALWRSEYAKSSNTQVGIKWLLGKQQSNGSWLSDSDATYHVIWVLNMTELNEVLEPINKGLRWLKDNMLTELSGNTRFLRSSFLFYNRIQLLY